MYPEDQGRIQDDPLLFRILSRSSRIQWEMGVSRYTRECTSELRCQQASADPYHVLAAAPLPDFSSALAVTPTTMVAVAAPRPSRSMTNPRRRIEGGIFRELYFTKYLLLSLVSAY